MRDKNVASPVPTRGVFVRRALASMFVALPAAKALVASPTASASGLLADPNYDPNYIDCVDRACQWTRTAGDCCRCCPFYCGERYQCIDPVTGSTCACACHSPYWPTTSSC